MMQKAVFLDRDGVINFERGTYNLSVDDFIINQGVGEAIALIKKHGFLVIVITNQGAIAKGLITQDDVEAMHHKLHNYLKQFETSVDEIYYCTHHEITSRCLCRKPSGLLIEKALARFKIDASQSFMIGDRERDIEAASAVGVKGILIDSNSSLIPICKQIVDGKI